MSDEHDSLEQQLFSWDDWDDNGFMSPQFYEVELKVPIGEFPVGHKFPTAFLSGDKSVISFMDAEEKEHVFQLILTAGKKLSQQELDTLYPHTACHCGADHE